MRVIKVTEHKHLVSIASQTWVCLVFAPNSHLNSQSDQATFLNLLLLSLIQLPSPFWCSRQRVCVQTCWVFAVWLADWLFASTSICINLFNWTGVPSKVAGECISACNLYASCNGCVSVHSDSSIVEGGGESGGADGTQSWGAAPPLGQFPPGKKNQLADFKLFQWYQGQCNA